MIDIENFLQQSNPQYFASKVAGNLKSLRLRKNISQEELSQKSGVSLASIRKLEQKGEISLLRLLRLAIVLEATDNFAQLFVDQEYSSIDEFLNSEKKKPKQRARIRKKTDQ